MTHQNDYNLTSYQAKKVLEAVPELLPVLINNVMQIEKPKYLQAAEYEQTEVGTAMRTDISQRQSGPKWVNHLCYAPSMRRRYHPFTLEKGVRSERAPSPTWLGAGRSNQLTWLRHGSIGRG